MPRAAVRCTRGGGTDSVSILNGQIFVTASAPTHSGRAATFRVRLSTFIKHVKTKVTSNGVTRIKSTKVVTHIAHLSPTFLDNAKATDAITGNDVTLHLTDPDSNALVPNNSGDLFAGDYVLNSQADDQLVFAAGLGGGHARLTRLALSFGPTGIKAGVDDVRWALRDYANLYVVDNKANKIYKIKGPFTAGEAIASLDTVGSASMGSTLATLNDGSGELDPFVTGMKSAKGLLFMP